MLRMVQISSLLVLVSQALGAQAPQPIRRLEFAFDVASQRNSGDDLLRKGNVPMSVRYGAVNSQYRFTLDQRLTFLDQRLAGQRSALVLDTQLGWRLGSSERVHAGVFGPYVFGAFNLTSAKGHYTDAPNSGGPLFGFAGGFGTRFALGHMVLRPELLVGHDLGSGERGDQYWVPARTSVSVRLGYGFQLPIGDR